MTIKKKLQLSILVAAGIALLSFGLILAWTSQHVSEAIEQSKVMDKIVKGVFELNIITNAYMLHHQKRAQAQWQLRYSSLAKLLTEVGAKDPEEEKMMGRVIQNHAEIQPLFSQMVKNSKSRGFSENEIALSMDLERRLVSQLAAKAQTMVEDTFRLAGMARARLEGAQRRGSFLLMAFGVIILTLMASFIILTSNNIVARIMNLHQGTEIIAAGDLDYQVDVGNRDEIGDLAHAFNEMTRQLRGSYQALKEEITERTRAEEDLKQHRNRLEEMVGERTSELDKRILEVEQLNSAMVNILEDLRASNENLEITARQLKDANKELESFSYSVSHDLRAPLRAIDGFSRMVVEDYWDKLDAEGKHQLKVIQDSAQEMGQLIDDLLAFSRLGRKAMTMSDIDMVQLAEEVFEKLTISDTEQTARLNIHKLPHAYGDISLIREVFMNLLSNAIKFTKPGETAVIELSGETKGEKIIYSVKDRGVGFDMKYSDKLFRVFQRLHSTEEFEGTGIGLALIQRIIHRHNGRAWAEAKENEGATFHFTLPIV